MDHAKSVAVQARVKLVIGHKNAISVKERVSNDGDREIPLNIYDKFIVSTSLVIDYWLFNEYLMF
jgi:hypothetical protein